MKFDTFAERADTIEELSSNLEIRSEVARLLSEAADHGPETLGPVARFIQGKTFPGWDERKLDIGPNYCYRAMAQASDAESADEIEEKVAEVGDVGEVAAQLDFGQQQSLAAFGSGGGASTTVSDVADEFAAIADMEGAGSQSEKIESLYALFTNCSGTGAKYIVRIILSEMRIGVGERTVARAINDAFCNGEAGDAVNRAVQVTNDDGEVATVAAYEGVEGLRNMEMQVGRPIKSMNAKTGTKSGVVDDWDDVAVGWKIDGGRIQAHHDGNEVRLFTRNMEEVTHALPEVVEVVQEHADGAMVIDGEAVAVDDNGDVIPFQNVLRRLRRKDRVEEMRDEVPLEFYAFDCLYHDGDLLDTPLRKRREILDDVYTGQTTPFTLTDQEADIVKMEKKALAEGHEGLMLKDPDSVYTAGKRGKEWRKVKPDTENLDLVVTGAEWGEGRRADFLGSYLLSARDGDDFKTIGRVGTGMTDEQLAELTDLLEPHIKSQDGSEVTIAPAVILEIGYEEVQESPTYGSGYALRFPRLETIRHEKPLDEVDSIDKVERQRRN